MNTTFAVDCVHLPNTYPNIIDKQILHTPTFHPQPRPKRSYCSSPFSMDCAMAMRLTCSLCMALCHTLLFASTTFSARNAFTMIFTSSEDLPGTLAAPHISPTHVDRQNASLHFQKNNFQHHNCLRLSVKRSGSYIFCFFRHRRG